MKGKDGVFIILTPGFPENEEETNCLPLQQTFVKTLKAVYPSVPVEVLSFQYPYHRDEYTWHGIPVTSFRGQNRNGLARRWVWQQVKRTLARRHSQQKIKGILSFWYDECAVIGKKFADSNDIIHRCWILGQDARPQNPYIEKTRPQPEELVALSEFLQDEFEKNHQIRPQHLVTPGIDLSLLKNEKMTRDIDLLAAGYLVPLKKFDVFIRVVAQLQKQIPAIKAMIAGRGPEKEKLQSLINELHLQNNITLSGELSHPAILQTMQQAKIFLHPSSYEGFSGVCLEALQAGARVISFTKPMRDDIPNWHIVQNENEMTEKALEVLQDTASSQPAAPWPIEDTVKKMMSLFGW
jgi:glycosyltransferase involved in cell wall biosynthesis